MRKLFLSVTALFVMAMVTVPSADAQEYGEKAKSHWMKGTMTPPGGEAMDVAYEVMKTEDGMKGWIVAEEDGEESKIAMSDLKMDGDYMTYSWSPPDDASLVISCKLKKQDDGGFAGDCMDNQEEGRTGQMTVAPMQAMNPCAADMKKMKDMKETKEMKEMNPCSG